MKINTAEIIRDLIQSGMTQSDIAKEIGVTQGAVSQVANSQGRRGFRFEAGYRLLRLHEKKTKGTSHA